MGLWWARLGTYVSTNHSGAMLFGVGNHDL